MGVRLVDNQVEHLVVYFLMVGDSMEGGKREQRRREGESRVGATETRAAERPCVWAPRANHENIKRKDAQQD